MILILFFVFLNLFIGFKIIYRTDYSLKTKFEEQNKIILVIFLTVNFMILSLKLPGRELFIFWIISFCIALPVIAFCFSFKKMKQVEKSYSSFLNSLLLSMSVGKSLAPAFKQAISYQKKELRPYYLDIYYKIFFLKEPKSSFFMEKHSFFYEKIFFIAQNNSNQMEKIKKFKVFLIKTYELERIKKSIMAPVIGQIMIFSILYVFLLIYHLNYNEWNGSVEPLSLFLFILGLLTTFIFARPMKSRF